ncbi:MAG: hypothetical protein ACI8UR_001379 [Natronomonas sp.]|jgi:hypothetical protein|uniref:hypothetical protein n=1 Tax=Natronomonas sp. TaxID=2184060 RepID=UPI00398A0B8B
MMDGRAVESLITALATGVITLVGASVVFHDPTGAELFQAALIGWVPLFVLLSMGNADPSRLSRFVFVFCGSLVGLSILLGSLVGYPMLNASLPRLAIVEFPIAVNPVMAVLVGGAMMLSYFAVFEWGADANGNGSDGRAV